LIAAFGDDLVPKKFLGAVTFGFGKLEPSFGGGKVDPLAHPIQPNMVKTNLIALRAQERVKVVLQESYLGLDNSEVSSQKLRVSGDDLRDSIARLHRVEEVRAELNEEPGFGADNVLANGLEFADESGWGNMATPDEHYGQQRAQTSNRGQDSKTKIAPALGRGNGNWRQGFPHRRYISDSSSA
jgi:hypothetical protein